VTTAFDELTHFASRILQIGSVGSDAPTARIVLDELATKTPEDIKAILEATARHGDLSEPQKNFVKAVVLGGHWVLAATGNHARLGQMVMMDLYTGDSFIVPYIQRGFRAWQRRRADDFYKWQKAQPAGKDTLEEYAKTLFDDDSFDAWKAIQPAGAAASKEDYLAWLAKNHDSPEAYVRASRREGSVMDELFKALLGENYERPPRGARRSRPKIPWAFFYRLTRSSADFANLGDTRAAAKALADLANKDLDDAVGKSLDRIGELDAEDSFGFTGNLLDTFLSRNPAARKNLVKKIRTVFDAYSTKGKVDEALLLRLIGNRKHHPQVIIDEMVGSFALLYEEVHKIKVIHNLDDAATDALLVKYLEIAAVENFFEMALRQMDHEHAYIFEQLIPLCYLKKGFDPDMVIAQSKIGDKAGPDLLILAPKKQYIEALLANRNAPLPATGLFEAQIVQEKSYKNLMDVIRATDTGAALEQAKSDAKRLIRNLVTQDKTGAENIGLQYGRTMFYKVNWARIEKDSSSFFDDVNGMVSEYFGEVSEIPFDVDGVVEILKKDDLVRMSPNELLHSSDPWISKAVRKAFYKKHVENYVTQLNEALKTYETEWVESFLKEGEAALPVDKILEALQTEIALAGAKSSVTNAAQRFERVKALFDKYPTDPAAQQQVLEAARTHLKDIYRGVFNLGDPPDDVIRIEVDLVDSMVDDDIVPLPDWLSKKLKDRLPKTESLH
jgi:hypothetical protein